MGIHPVQSLARAFLAELFCPSAVNPSKLNKILETVYNRSLGDAFEVQIFLELPDQSKTQLLLSAPNGRPVTALLSSVIDVKEELWLRAQTMFPVEASEVTAEGFPAAGVILKGGKAFVAIASSLLPAAGFLNGRAIYSEGKWELSDASAPEVEVADLTCVDTSAVALVTH